MSEKVYKPTEEIDEMMSLIVERLAKRQEKLDCMAAWERSARKVNLRPIAFVMAVAACFALVYLLVPSRESALSPLEKVGISAPSFEDYRASMPTMNEIQGLIEAENFAEALIVTQKALHHSDVEIDELDFAMMVCNDESLDYERTAEMEINSQLRWTCIYLLVKTEQYAEARKELKRYLKEKDFCPHRDEAKVLMKALKKKNGKK